MNAFWHKTPHSNINTLEFLRTLSKTPGVRIITYGYESVDNYFGYSILFFADKQAELFLRLKFGEIYQRHEYKV